MSLTSILRGLRTKYDEQRDLRLRAHEHAGSQSVRAEGLLERIGRDTFAPLSRNGRLSDARSQR